MITRDEIISGQIAPLRRNLVRLIEIEKELNKSITEKNEYLTVQAPHEVAVIEGRINSKTIELRSVESQIETKKTELSHLKDSHDIEHGNHNDRILTLRKEIKSDEALVVSLQNEIEKLNLSGKNLVKEVNRLVEEKQKLVEEHDEILILVKEARKILRALGKEINELVKAKKKLEDDILRIKNTKDILVEDVLTDNHKKLYDRHQVQLGKSKALDEQILQKRKKLKE